MNCAALLRFTVRDEADSSDRELCEVGVTDRCAALLTVDQPRRLLIVGKRLVDRDHEFACRDVVQGASIG